MIHGENPPYTVWWRGNFAAEASAYGNAPHFDSAEAPAFGGTLYAHCMGDVT
ncbi:MAG: hypothetical protein LBT55_07200 [Clostridiaceae bacterium]|nr:hypothetical protein [Clostridiaceae bacterium]